MAVEAVRERRLREKERKKERILKKKSSVCSTPALRYRQVFSLSIFLAIKSSFSRAKLFVIHEMTRLCVRVSKREREKESVWGREVARKKKNASLSSLFLKNKQRKTLSLFFSCYIASRFTERD